VTVAYINYLDIPETINDGTVFITGQIGSVSQTDSQISIEIRSKIDKLNRSVSKKVSPICTNQFGDPKCGIDIADWKRTRTALVNGNSTKNILINGGFGQDYDLWTYGEVVCILGNNKGVRRAILDANEENLNLTESMPYIIEAGSQYDCFPTCDRTMATCARFNNLDKFRGFAPVTPNFLPGKDRLSSGS
jgi:uncharacterized phage protein (TIGR02218 family)